MPYFLDCMDEVLDALLVLVSTFGLVSSNYPSFCLRTLTNEFNGDFTVLVKPAKAVIHRFLLSLVTVVLARCHLTPQHNYEDVYSSC